MTGKHSQTNYTRYEDVARERIAQWMISHAYATGHGDTIDDLLGELEWQAKERGRYPADPLAEDTMHNLDMRTERPVKATPEAELDRVHARNNELYRMVKFLFDHQGECIGDHPDWVAGMDKLLDGESFDAALATLKTAQS